MRELFAELLALAVAMPAGPLLLPLFSVLVLWALFDWSFPASTEPATGLRRHPEMASQTLPTHLSASLPLHANGTGRDDKIKPSNLRNVRNRAPFERKRGHWLSAREIATHNNAIEQANTDTNVAKDALDLASQTPVSPATVAPTLATTGNQQNKTRADTRRSPSQISKRARPVLTQDTTEKLVANSQTRSDSSLLPATESSNPVADTRQSPAVKSDSSTIESGQTEQTNQISGLMTPSGPLARHNNPSSTTGYAADPAQTRDFRTAENRQTSNETSNQTNKQNSNLDIAAPESGTAAVKTASHTKADQTDEANANNIKPATTTTLARSGAPGNTATDLESASNTGADTGQKSETVAVGTNSPTQKNNQIDADDNPAAVLDSKQRNVQGKPTTTNAHSANTEKANHYGNAKDSHHRDTTNDHLAAISTGTSTGDPKTPSLTNNSDQLITSHSEKLLPAGTQSSTQSGSAALDQSTTATKADTGSDSLQRTNKQSIAEAPQQKSLTANAQTHPGETTTANPHTTDPSQANNNPAENHDSTAANNASARLSNETKHNSLSTKDLPNGSGRNEAQPLTTETTEQSASSFDSARSTESNESTESTEATEDSVTDSESRQPRYQTAAKFRQMSTTVEAQLQLRPPTANKGAISDADNNSTSSHTDEKNTEILAAKNQQIAQLQQKIAALEAATQQQKHAAKQQHGATTTENGNSGLSSPHSITDPNHNRQGNLPTDLKQAQPKPLQAASLADGSAAARQGDDNSDETNRSSNSTDQPTTTNQTHADNIAESTDPSAVALDDPITFKRRFQQATDMLTLKERKIENLQSTINRLQAAGLTELANTPDTPHDREPLLNKVRVLM